MPVFLKIITGPLTKEDCCWKVCSFCAAVESVQIEHADRLNATDLKVEVLKVNRAKVEDAAIVIL